MNDQPKPGTVGAVLAHKAPKQAPVKKWNGSPITACDICAKPIGALFIDGRTQQGPWGIMDPKCHRVYGVGLGTGKGQAYARQPNGEWHKVGG